MNRLTTLAVVSLAFGMCLTGCQSSNSSTADARDREARAQETRADMRSTSEQKTPRSAQAKMEQMGMNAPNVDRARSEQPAGEKSPLAAKTGVTQGDRTTDQATEQTPEVTHEVTLRSDAAVDHARMAADEKGKTATAVIKPAPGATTQPTWGNVTGTVTFTDVGHGVEVKAHIMGLKPNSKHGFHIHQKGDLSSNDLSSAGGHWDPMKSGQHGGPDSAKHHAGDLGNLQADSTGMAMLDTTVHGATIGGGGDNDIVGKSVIVHGGEDDLKSNPAGNSGPRIAGGIITMGTSGGGK
jgi:Cu-Zn family superoxide dismutase